MKDEEASLYEVLLEDHRHDPARAGEGDVVELADGRLLILYSRFEGGGDHDPAPVVQRSSGDGGRTWSDAEVLWRPPPGSLNLMSISLLRLADGRLGCLVLHKQALDNCFPEWRFSEDEGLTWSDALRVNRRRGYHVVNNDRVLQLFTGRILIPYAWREDGSQCAYPLVGCFISDDGGGSWRRGRQEHAIENRDLVPWPEPVDPAFAAAAPPPGQRRAKTQEPGVVELSDGRVMLHARSDSGYAWRCFSDDGGETFSSFEPIREFAIACGPTAVKRLPGSTRLVMVYNDRAGVPYSTGYPFMWRTPLAVAASDDDGQSWHRLACDIESDDSVNYCYASFSFFDRNRKVVLSYYVGWPSELDADGRPKAESRRKLASLKVKVVDRKFFEDGERALPCQGKEHTSLRWRAQRFVYARPRPGGMLAGRNRTWRERI